MLTASAISLGGLGAADRIEWEPVAGADHYQVEFRQNGVRVALMQRDVPNLPLVLPPGEYEFKVDVIGPFGNAIVSSEWKPLRILASPQPLILDFTPRALYSGDEMSFISRVTGYRGGEKENSTFHLENDAGRKVPLQVENAEERNDGEAPWTEVSLKPNRKVLPAGDWSLVMTNPRREANRMDKALTIQKRLRPRIKRVIPRFLTMGKAYNPLEMKVSGMELDAEILFEGPSDLNVTLLEEGDGKLHHSLDLTDVEPGRYSITVTNPSGRSHKKKRAFTVMAPKAPPADSLITRVSARLEKNRPPPHTPIPALTAYRVFDEFPGGGRGNGFRPQFLGFRSDFFSRCVQ